MAATSGAMAASSLSSLKKMDSMVPGSLQQARSVELKGRVAGKGQRISRAVRVAGVRNAAPELAEMEPASQGSQLLGEIFSLYVTHAPFFKTDNRPC